MAQSDNHPDPKTRKGQKHRQELAPNTHTVPSGQNAGKASAAKNADTHPSTPCSTWPSAETLDTYSTVNDHHRHCCRLLKKKPGSPNSARRVRLTAAFHNEDHQQLLDCVFNTNLPATIRRWIYNYIQNRQAKVHYRQKQKCKSRKVKTGVVQGEVLSPALFNYYLADFPSPPPNIKLIKDADDITIYTSGPVVADLINGLNIYLSQVPSYINNKKLTVSTEKSTITLFTPDTHEHHLLPQVKFADQVLLLEKKLKVLGVTLDTHLTFANTATISQKKCSLAKNVLNSQAGSTWGYDKKTLLATYQAIGRSILSCSCPVWTPSLRTLTGAGSNGHKIQR